MRWVILSMGLLATGAVAEETIRLTGEQIMTSLTGQALSYEQGLIQSFGADGSTQYGDSTGQWRLTDNRYCSVWPPSDRWACFDVYTIDGGIRFVGDTGELTEGLFVTEAD